MSAREANKYKIAGCAWTVSAAGFVYFEEIVLKT